MGTRHLIVVVKDGEVKIAQYGQWDGYIQGQGVDILKFLRKDGNIDGLRVGLDKCRWVSQEFLDEYNSNAPKFPSDPDNRSDEQKRWFELYITRDLGWKILENVAWAGDEIVQLVNSYDFAFDSLFCEYVYVIDFDKNTFEVYKGFNKDGTHEDERFHGPQDKENGYYPVRFLRSFQLDALPDEAYFIEELNHIMGIEEDE